MILNTNASPHYWSSKMAPKVLSATMICVCIFMLYSPMSRIPLLSPFAKDPSPEEASIDSTELAIVVASKQDSNTEWMDQLTRKSSWNPYIYNVDAVDENATLRIPAQKGHEAMVYLTFIIDRWDDLPKYTTFIHGHETAWHQESDVFDLLTNIRLNVLDSVGYIPLRCDWYPSCPAEIRPITHDAIVWGTGLWRSDTEWGITGVWPLFFPDAPLPETIAAPCCAQFVVTRDAIRSRSKETYITMRNWILSTHIVDNVTGRVMEKLWAYIFTDEAVHCPPPGTCACDYFGKCEKQQWLRPPEGLQGWD